MSKMSELSQVLDELTACGETLIKTAKTIREIFKGEAEQAEIETEKTAKTKKEISANGRKYEET